MEFFPTPFNKSFSPEAALRPKLWDFSLKRVYRRDNLLQCTYLCTHQGESVSITSTHIPWGWLKFWCSLFTQISVSHRQIISFSRKGFSLTVVPDEHIPSSRWSDGLAVRYAQGFWRCVTSCHVPTYSSSPSVSTNTWCRWLVWYFSISFVLILI